MATVTTAATTASARVTALGNGEGDGDGDGGSDEGEGEGEVEREGEGEGEGGDGKRSQSVRDSRKKQKHNPQTDSGTPQTGLGRDTTLFQIGESPKRFGVSSKSGTDMHTSLL